MVSFIHLDFIKEKGIAYLRRWNDEAHKWIPDSRFPEGFHFPLPSLPLYSKKSKEGVKDAQRLCSELKEWKHIHTKSQSLITKFSVAQGFLDKGLFLEAGSEIERCFADLSALQSIAKNFSIMKNDAIYTCLKNNAESPDISKLIAKAQDNGDARKAQNKILKIKRDFETTLKVADYHIVNLVEELIKIS